MRDPSARLRFSGEQVIRELTTPLDDGHFLRSKLAQEWRERGDLVEFAIADPSTVIAKRLPFVTQPGEWCDWQLFQAASLTLRLQREAVSAGYDMKDASAWNIIFDGCRPVFCDLLSFEPLRQRRWRAAGQFARHFLLPLLVAKRRGLSTSKTFRAWRDGMPEDVARRMLGPARFLTRYWPLMSGGPFVEYARQDSDAERVPAHYARFRESLDAGLNWMLAGVRPKASQDLHTEWGDYVERRSHYESASLDVKRASIADWLRRLQPRAVLDLGCNSGEFSRMASDAGASVIALDADEGAIRRLCETPAVGVHPVLVPLDDLSAGRGWAGSEHPGLPERLHQRVDLTLVLALIHHLAIGAAIPLAAIAAFVSKTTRQWLVVEWLSEQDVQVQALCERFDRSPAEFTVAAQMQAFESLGWRQLEARPLPGGMRTLALLGRSP